MNPATPPARAVSFLAVVGTDTGVGKTRAARALLDAALARGVRAAALKPFASGARDGRWEDWDLLDPAHRYRPPGLYRAALSPYGAVRRGEEEIPLADADAFVARAAAENERVIIEGIGGVMVPLNRSTLWIDWHAAHAWPSLLVARGGLGTLNHTLLTMEALASRAIPVEGFVLNGGEGEREAAEENARILEERSRVVCRGIVDYDPRDGAGAWRRALAAVERES